MTDQTSVDKLGAELVGTMPEPNAAAIQAGPPGEQPAPVADLSQSSEKAGFDPAIHVADENGRPVLTKDGAFRNKPGRKRGPSVVGNPGPVNMANAPQVSRAETQRLELEHRAALAGAGAANLLITCGLIVGGADFQPGKSVITGLDEREFLTAEFKQYFVATGKSDLPPVIGLCAAILVYVAPRFSKPSVAARVTGMKSWFKAKFAKK